MNGASSPTSTIAPSTTSATRDDGLRRMLRTVRPSGDSRGRPGLAAAESWVGPGIKQVGKKTSKRDHDTADNYAAHNQWIIARADGIDDSVAHAGPRENLLDEKSAGQERGKGESHQGDNRQQRVTQRVTPQDLTLRQTLETCSADVIGGQHVEQSGALVARDGGRSEEGQRQRWQREMLQAIGDASGEAHVVVHDRIHRTTDGKNRQPVGERQQRQNRQPEIRHREKQQRDSAQRVVYDGTAPRYLNQRNQNPKGEAADEGYRHQQERVG